MRAFLSDDPLVRSRRDRFLLALGVLLALVLVLRAARKEDGVLVRNQEWGARFLAGEDPYFDPARGHRIHGPYPPSYALVTAPLALLPETPARVVWSLAQIAALLSLWVLARRWLRAGWPELAAHSGVVFAGALLLASRYLLRDFAGGGGNLLFATSLAWGFECARARLTLVSGVLLAVPLALKPNLAPFLLVFVALGRWRLMATVAVALVAVVALPALLHGHAGAESARAYAALFQRWFVDVAAYARLDDPARVDLVPEGFPVSDTTMNQSLRDAFLRAREALGWSADVASGVARALGIALVALGLFIVHRARGPRAELLAALAFLPIALLLSPIAWKAHHAALVPLFVVLVASALATERPRWLVPGLVAYYLACVLTGEELVGKAAKEALQAWSIVTWFTLGLVTIAWVLAWRSSQTHARSARSAA